MATAAHAMLALLTVLIAASGCSSGSSSGRARPSLSDAMEQAQKPPEEQEVVRPQKTKAENSSSETGPKDSSASGDEIVVVEAQLTPPVVAPADSVATDPAHFDSAPAPQVHEAAGSDEGMRFGGFAGGGTLSRGAWTRYRTFGVFVGAQRRGGSAVLRAAAYVPRIDDNTVGTALSSAFGMYIEGFGILNLMPEHTVMDIGPAALFRIGFLDWTYENPITVADGDGTRDYHGDTLGLFTLMIGPALTPLRSSNLSVGIALMGGGQLYTENTLHGFTNDVFDASWILEFTIDVAYRRVGDPLD